MARQISMEAGLAAYRKKCNELFDANVLLEAQLEELERENEQLRNAACANATEATVAPGDYAHPDGQRA
ncbi:hypothetical protein [Streptomyces sp. NRRL B-24720]|uniref:hypothetical protein n=1 Tax=Streptomyces sp. NRRL B-24720 TaxID=1476876 RepID=UPI0004C9F1E6|nr:hypothetical protein [Streptomyces sp. NRRL B-24720]